MVVGQFDSGSIPRNAQGPKSTAFHFEAPVCAACNGTITQDADREFDRFRRKMESISGDVIDPSSVLEEERYAKGSEAYLNVFRYFAKILACHVAQSKGPRAIDVTNFARGITNRNVVQLWIDIDPTYRSFAELHGKHSYAAHGGLMVPMDKNTRLVTGFRSFLTFGPVRYTFWVEFGPVVGLALSLAHRTFHNKCLVAYEEALLLSNTQ